jgi:transposase
MIPKDHICFLVEDFVNQLDFSKFDLIYDGAGHPAYHPRVIMKILVYGNIKQNLGFREFLPRGKEKVKIEFNLACIAHNLRKNQVNLCSDKTPCT